MSTNPRPVCPACKTDWVARSHRGKLERLLHRNEKKYVCEKCNRTFYLDRDEERAASQTS